MLDIQVYICVSVLEIVVIIIIIWALEFLGIIVHFVVILSTVTKYSVLKLVYTQCTGGVEGIGSKLKLWVSLAL